jgi:hypothetical protein
MGEILKISLCFCAILICHLGLSKKSTVLTKYSNFFIKDTVSFYDYKDTTYKKNRFNTQIELAIGRATFHKTLIGLRVVEGVKFNKRYFVGLGAGVVYHSNYYGNIYYIGYTEFPIFLRVSYDLMLNKNTPYLFSDFGSQVQLHMPEKVLKPLNVRLGIGFKTKSFYSSLACGYGRTRSYYIFNSTHGYTFWQRNYRAELCFGWKFN